MEVEFTQVDSHFVLPRLFKKNSKGKIQEWSVGVLDNFDGTFSISTVHGQMDGKMQKSIDVISEGKNIGKANETSVKTQALSEAKSKWVKQQERRGYHLDPNKVDEDERPGVEPMLAQTYATIIEGQIEYTNYSKKIKFPCAMQPKLDGHRSPAKDGLRSRNRVEITGLPHISAQVENLKSHFPLFVPDGELYNHAYKDNFEELSGFITSKEPKEGHEVVQYHIYDAVIPGKFEERIRKIAEVFADYTGDILHLVPTIIVNNKEEAEQAFWDFKKQGYEGAILRNLDSEYQGKRTADLQKFKEFMDDEFEIIGVKDGRGKMKGKAVFICKSHNGETFDVKMKGSMELLEEIFQNQDQYIGRKLTVYFDKYTNKGIPRFPVGLRLYVEI